MSKGGYRPGSGPKKGAKYRPRKGKKPKPTPRKPKKPPEQDKIQQTPELSEKEIKRRFYREFQNRKAKGEKLTVPEMKMMLSLSAELSAEIGDEGIKTTGAPDENLTPLDLMLRGMRDPNEPKETRYRLAIAAAPFIHPRKGEGQGKKEDKADRAKVAGAGRFAASKPPVLKVVGK